MTTNTEAGALARLALAERALKRVAIERSLDAAGVIGEDRILVVERMSRYVVLSERDGELVANAADEKGVERLGSRGLPVSVDALAEEFREKFPRNFLKRDKAPIGATASPAGSAWKGPNPFSTESRNLTKQAELYRTDRPLYDRWRAEAEGASAPAPKPAVAPLAGDLARFFRPGSEYNLTMIGRIYREDRAAYDRITAALGSWERSE